jgi:hypothetical protein
MLLQMMIQLEIPMLFPRALTHPAQDIVHTVPLNLLFEV